MKNRNFSGKYLKIILIAAAAVLVVSRIIYVNIFYPQTKREYRNMGENVEFGDFEVRLNGILTYDGQSFDAYALQHIEGYTSQFMQEIMAGQEEYYVYMVSLTVKNISQEEQDYQYGARAVLEIENVSNGAHPFLNRMINGGENLRVTLAPGESRELEVAYTIPNNIMVDDGRFEGLEDIPCRYSLKSYEKLITIWCHSQKGA